MAEPKRIRTDGTRKRVVHVTGQHPSKSGGGDVAKGVRVGAKTYSPAYLRRLKKRDPEQFERLMKRLGS